MFNKKTMMFNKNPVRQKKLVLSHIITLLALSCLSSNVFAEDIALQKNHPDRHVVVKGDTLWGISEIGRAHV